MAINNTNNDTHCVKMSPKGVTQFTIDYNSPYPHLCHNVPIKLLIDCFRKLHGIKTKHTDESYINAHSGRISYFISLNTYAFNEHPIPQWKLLEDSSKEFSFYNGPGPKHSCIKIVDYVLVQFIDMIINNFDDDDELKKEAIEVIEETKKSNVKIIKMQDMLALSGNISYHYDASPSNYSNLISHY